MNYPKEFAGAEVWHQHGVTGDGVVVAVIDTGVYKHEDLTVRDDGFATIDGNKPTDDFNPYGHGTHVAGIAAGHIYGVAPDAEVLPIKITDNANSTTNGQELVEALQYVMTWHKKYPTKRVVVNISFSNTHYPSIVDEIDKLVAEGIPVVVAACNDGDEKSPIAEYDSPIVVANLLSDSKMNDSSSCWGDLTDCCVIGSSVWSCKNAEAGYRSLTGTSMASPAVAGMMTLILSRWPDISEADAYKYLMDNATPAEVKCPSGIHQIPRVELPDDFAENVNPDKPDDNKDDQIAEAQFVHDTMYISGVSEGKALIVRELPDTKSDKVANLFNDDEVTVLAYVGGRALVSTGTSGWVAKSYLTDTPSIIEEPDKPVEEKPVENGKVSIVDMMNYYKPHAVKTNSKAPDNPPADQWGYVMGGDGRVATADYLVQRAKSSYPDSWERYVERTTKWLGRPVYDCNALAEAYYKQRTGTDINTKARSNYANWCSIKSPETPDSKLTGIPQQAGVAVFSGDTAKTITHVGFLLEKYGDGDLDWYVLEARGADYGLVITKLTERAWRWWGVMDKYFTYAEAIEAPDTAEVRFATCTGNSVNVREGRGTNYASIGKLNKGDKMLALGAVDSWCEVACEINGKLATGYMSSQYVGEA